MGMNNFIQIFPEILGKIYMDMLYVMKNIQLSSFTDEQKKNIAKESFYATKTRQEIFNLIMQQKITDNVFKNEFYHLC